ncbi:MAG: YigZ family protein [Candidatus Izemoplasmatales bacterium]
MRSIQAATVVETTVSKSRFIAHVAPVRCAADAAAFLAEVKRLHPDATHHCHAHVLGADGSVHRASDDGEPGGTAGTPMLETIRRTGMTDVCAVVVRYFGGVKLGAGGLARAYAGAVRAALAAARPTDPVRYLRMETSAPPASAGIVEHILRETAIELSAAYGEPTVFRFLVRDRDADALRERLVRIEAVATAESGADIRYE